MIQVSNRKVISRLSLRSLRASRTRNVVAILAIALTTILFTSLFTIAASINYSFQQENFRQAGGDMHGSVKDVTWEQVEQMRQDPLVVESGARFFLGLATDQPFNKSQVEVSYLEPQAAPHYFCKPVEGTLPQEGTDQAATDTRVLALLGVEPKVGTQFTLPFYIDENTTSPTLITRTFTLSGWWEYDSAVVASHVLLPRTAAEEIAALSNGSDKTMTGHWNLDVNFNNSLGIRDDLTTLLANHGYQTDDPQGENYLNIGVNWGYSGAQMSNNADPLTMMAMGGILLLIVFTGYLIIYNVFQISVANDIRFYGLLKTIGTTGRQIKRMIRRQALMLSLVGIPVGLLLGFLIGNKLTPIIMATLSYKNAFVSFNPWIFIGAALFALVTVAISCAKPGRTAAKVSPVEAVRYTEGGGGKKSVKKGAGGAKLSAMAWANLGRNRSKTAVTVLSLALAVVLMTTTYSFAAGFDMDKYLERNVTTDFVLGDASYFRTGIGFGTEDQSVSEDVIKQVNDQGGITEAGRIYGQTFSAQEFVTEDWFRQMWGRWSSPEELDHKMASAETLPNGLLADRVQLYGMEAFPLSKLEVLEGDLAPLSDPSQQAIAAVYMQDDYGDPRMDSHWAKVGDRVTVRYVEKYEYYYTDTGEVIPEFNESVTEGSRPYNSRATVYRDVEYTICALVTVPNALSYRFYGADQFVLGAERFIQDTGTSPVMTYVYNTTDESNDGMEAFLAQFTETIQPLYDYESKQFYEEEFQGFRNMFLTMGGALSFIIGMVGVLNFINAVLTGILTRRREFAVLQSIGMTGRQLKTMLVCEGLYYTVLALGTSLVLALVTGPLLGKACAGIFWFFTYHFTVLPVAAVLPVFLILGCLVPLVTYRSAARHTIVERLREVE